MAAVDMRDEMLGLIADSLRLYGNQWRTVHGIARDIGRDPRTVAEYVASHPHDFIGSRIKLAGVQAVRLRSDSDGRSVPAGALRVGELLGIRPAMASSVQGDADEA